MFFSCFIFPFGSYAKFPGGTVICVNGQFKPFLRFEKLKRHFIPIQENNPVCRFPKSRYASSNAVSGIPHFYFVFIFYYMNDSCFNQRNFLLFFLFCVQFILL